MSRREPVFHLPFVVVASAAVLVAVHVARLPLSEDSDFRLLLTFGFIPVRYSVAGALIPGGAGARLWSPFTYAFIHADLTHLLVNLLWMAAFGSAVARRFGAARFLVLATVSAASGAAFHFAAMPTGQAVMIGASAAVSGLTAATARFAFARGGPLAGASRHVQAYVQPAPSLVRTFADPRAMFFIAVWFGINLLFGVNSAILPGIGGAIAWQAHIGGFVAGLLLFGALDPVGGEQKDGDPRNPHLRL